MTRLVAVAAVCGLLVACAGGERSATPDEETFTPLPLTTERVGETGSLDAPSSVRYDPDRDLF